MPFALTLAPLALLAPLDRIDGILIYLSITYRHTWQGCQECQHECENVCLAPLKCPRGGRFLGLHYAKLHQEQVTYVKPIYRQRSFNLATFSFMKTRILPFLRRG